MQWVYGVFAALAAAGACVLLDFLFHKALARGPQTTEPPRPAPRAETPPVPLRPEAEDGDRPTRHAA